MTTAVDPGVAGRLGRWIPAAGWLRSYRPSWFRDDLVAGVVLAAFLVPVGMGYAQAAGLPAVTGLYASIGPLLAYALLGPSRILVLGPDSSLAPLIAAAVLPLAAGSQSEAVAVAASLAILTGSVAIVLGLAGFGFLATLLSRPVRVGYLDGIAVTVIVGQLPALFGFSTDADSFLGEITAFAAGVRDGLVEPAALLIGGAVLAAILVMRRVRPRAPTVLVAVVVATLAVSALGLAGTIPVVGVVPQGLPGLALPRLDLPTISALLPAAIGIALVSFADTSVLSRSLLRRGDPPVDQGRELVALGAADVAAGLTSGFPISSSASRTPVAAAAGARTQLTGVVAAALLAAILIAVPGILSDLPHAALAAVVIASALGYLDWQIASRLARTRPSELALLTACFLGVVLLGVLEGVVIAVVLSLLDVIRRVWRPHDAVLGRLPDQKGYHDSGRHGRIAFVPELLIYRWDAPLFFANADLFRERVLATLAREARPVSTLLVAGEPITDIDWTAAEMLDELLTDLDADGVRLAFAELKGPVKDRLRAYGLYDRIGDDDFFPTIGKAVDSHVERTGVTWDDPAEPSVTVEGGTPDAPGSDLADRPT